MDKGEVVFSGAWQLDTVSVVKEYTSMSYLFNVKSCSIAFWDFTKTY
jgi:hypothetical protein